MVTSGEKVHIKAQYSWYFGEGDTLGRLEALNENIICAYACIHVTY